MRANRYSPCIAWRIALIAGTLTFGGCDAVNQIADKVGNVGNNADVYYYLSLGTSLAVGVQPNSSGVLLPSNDGYADQLFDSIQPAFDAAGAQPQELRLVKLGCPGETLDQMVNGGSCPYLAGSQLDAAVDFLTDNMGRVHLVTIDMGANDLGNADCIGATIDPVCVNLASTQISNELAAVLTTLRNAAGPDTTIVGMNYYNPFLSSWLEDAAGQALAIESSLVAAVFMADLDATYDAAGMPSADVALAFGSDDDFTTLVPTLLPAPNDFLPPSVAAICSFTYMCEPAPQGPDIHANTAGYSLIAATIEGVLPASP